MGRTDKFLIVSAVEKHHSILGYYILWRAQPRALGRAAVTHALPAGALHAKSARRRLSVSHTDVRAAVAEAARQSVRDQLIQHAGKRLVLLEHKSEEAWGTPTKVTRRTSGRPHTCQGTLEK